MLFRQAAQAKPASVQAPRGLDRLRTPRASVGSSGGRPLCRFRQHTLAGAILLVQVVAFAAAAMPADLLAGRLASATDPAFLLLEE